MQSNMSSGPEAVLHTFDFTAIDELDPSIADGHRVIFDREAPFELRYAEGEEPVLNEIGTLEAIRCKILVKGPSNAPEDVRIEISSENDLFFLYCHSVDQQAFVQMQHDQKLMIDFKDYPNVLSKMLNSSIKEPHAYLAVLILGTTGLARLDLIRNMEYKFVDLMSVPFEAAPDDMIKVHITYRYNAAKSKLALMHARLQDINTLVKIKNPSLLVQLHHQHQASQQQNQSGSSLKPDARRRR